MQPISKRNTSISTLSTGKARNREQKQREIESPGQASNRFHGGCRLSEPRARTEAQADWSASFSCVSVSHIKKEGEREREIQRYRDGDGDGDGDGESEGERERD